MNRSIEKMEYIFEKRWPAQKSRGFLKHTNYGWIDSDRYISVYPPSLWYCLNFASRLNSWDYPSPPSGVSVIILKVKVFACFCILFHGA